MLFQPHVNFNSKSRHMDHARKVLINLPRVIRMPIPPCHRLPHMSQPDLHSVVLPTDDVHEDVQHITLQALLRAELIECTHLFPFPVGRPWTERDLVLEQLYIGKACLVHPPREPIAIYHFECQPHLLPCLDQQGTPLGPDGVFGHAAVVSLNMDAKIHVLDPLRLSEVSSISTADNIQV